MSAELLDTLRIEAATAIASGDYATAQQKIVGAMALIETLPNMTGGLSSVQWRSSFDSLLKQIRELKFASRSPILRVPIRHKRPENLEDCA